MVQVDARKEVPPPSTLCDLSPPTSPSPPPVDEDARSTGSRGLVYITISFVGVMMCALGVWLKRRRSSDLDRKLV